MLYNSPKISNQDDITTNKYSQYHLNNSGKYFKFKVVYLCFRFRNKIQILKRLKLNKSIQKQKSTIITIRLNIST